MAFTDMRSNKESTLRFLELFGSNEKQQGAR
jgi:hypothetical protein